MWKTHNNIHILSFPLNPPSSSTSATPPAPIGYLMQVANFCHMTYLYVPDANDLSLKSYKSQAWSHPLRTFPDKNKPWTYCMMRILWPNLWWTPSCQCSANLHNLHACKVTTPIKPYRTIEATSDSCDNVELSISIDFHWTPFHRSPGFTLS